MYTVPKDTQITPDIIKAAILFNETGRPRYNRLENYYRGFHDIMKRKKTGTMLKNNKLVTNFANYIVKVNVGYLLGNPIEYQAEDGVNIQDIVDMYEEQNISMTDKKIGKALSKLGKAYDYSYVIGDVVHSKYVDPRNAVLICDDTFECTVLAAIIYDSVDHNYNRPLNEQQMFFHNVSVITDTEVIIYDKEVSEILESTLHPFKVVPVIEYRNNDECESDYEQVVSLMNAYNILMSDRINDKEQLVESLLIFYGFTLNEDQMKVMREERAMSTPDSASRAEYLTKQLQEESLEVLRKAIKDDIHKIAMTPDLSDENFVGNSSGVAIKYKLINFEQNAIGKQGFFEHSARQRFSIYNNFLNVIKNLPLVPLHKIDLIFKRNLPQNDLEISQMIGNVWGKISDETAIGQLSYIDNAKEELDQARKDALDRAQAMAAQFGTPVPSKGGVTGTTDPNAKIDPNADPNAKPGEKVVPTKTNNAAK